MTVSDLYTVPLIVELRIALPDASLDAPVSRNDPWLLLDNSEQVPSVLCASAQHSAWRWIVLWKGLFLSLRKNLDNSLIEDVWLLDWQS